ncbi:MAG: hypothetical protein ACYDEO_28665 [Aggregatilineales bacterium]
MMRFSSRLRRISGLALVLERSPQIAYPVAATLGKDTGFQGYEPPGVVTWQPKKSPEARI